MSEQPASTGRTTFHDELIRRRRAAWIVAVVCALVSAGVGLVLSTIVTPTVLLVVGGLLRLVALLGVLDSLALGGVALIQDFVATHLGNVDHFSQTLDHVDSLGDIALLAWPLARLAPAALPALLAAVLVWFWLRGVFGRTGSQDLVVRLAARPANRDDFEERQLANIVEEVAIAAGAPPPSLFPVDTPAVNAAALGSPGAGYDEGIVLFTRGMLDRLDRGETEAVAARLVSAIGAGDVRAAAGIMAALHTLGFFLTLLDLPLRRSAWRTLTGLLAVSLSRRAGSGRTGADTLARVGEGLEEGLQADAIPDLDTIASEAPRLVARIVRFLLLPFYLVSVFYKLVLFLWTSLFLGPPLALLWRNRCHWTDAHTVKLARNPEAFARALESIGAADPPPGGEAFAWLFVAAPTTERRIVTARRTLALALAPPTLERLERLSAMGAAPRGWRTPGLANLAAHPLRALVVAALGLLLVPLFAILVLAIGFLTAIVMMVGLVAGLMIVQVLI
ncbi:MAG: M48 family metalloprotease [Reyranella sp.]